MPILTDREKQTVRANVSAPSIAGESTMDLYRSPAEVNGKTGAATLLTSGVALRLRPAGDNPKLIALAQPVNAARVEFLGKVAVGTDVAVGDEGRIGALRYRVEGVGVWSNATLIALSLIKKG